jgi:VWFA-related protein
MAIDLMSQLLSAAIGAFGLGLVAFAGLLLFRVRSPVTRHASWTVVLVGMLLQIPLGMVAPAVPLQALPVLSPPVQSLIESLIEPRVVERARNSVPPALALVPESYTRTAQRSSRVSAGGIFIVIYLAISILLFVRMAIGFWGLRRIRRDAGPIPRLGPDICESSLFVVPGSVGCFRAKIILPQDWKDWGVVKLRAVLAHERAHIRRRDWLIRVASQANVCIFWFHPLAWWMDHELARLAEDACDDAAVSMMDDREEYAATLVDIARAAAANRRVLDWRVIWMAESSNVLRRVNRILSQKLQVPRPFGRLAWGTLFMCSLPAIYLSAAVRLTSPVGEPATPGHAEVTKRAAEGQRQLTLPEERSSLGLIAQSAPIQPRSPVQSPTPARRDDPAIAMCIVLDNSGSVRDKRTAVKAAALALVKASKPDDDVCIIYFNDEVFDGLPQGEDFAAGTGEMEEALTHLDSRGGKAMRDAVWRSLDVEQTARHDRKVLVLVTEGNDTASRVTQEQLLSKIRNSGVVVYSIGLLNRDELQRSAAAKLALGQLADASGGLAYYPGDLSELENISSEIASAVRTQ